LDCKESISDEIRWKKESRNTKIKWLDCIDNDLKSMGAKRWRKKAEGRSVWAIMLKEALVKL
jgi:hypothetical protein